MLSLIENNYKNNFEAQEAIRLIGYTNQSVFLTGKAGAGKSYLLQRITEQTAKKHIILAPTGVAALNVGGQTIHSFFQIDTRPHLPNDRDIKILSEEKRELLQKLDLIIIDEVSMVRCDLLQAVDISLRKNLRSTQPFAGKQLFLIGDLFQLPPVVDTKNREEVEIIEHNYVTPYFFSAQSFSNGFGVQIVELQKIYRQTDKKFIEVLNAVRNNTVLTQHLNTINSRYLPTYQPPEGAFEITLTTTNPLANTTNATKIEALAGTMSEYRATLTGDFTKDINSESRLPAPKLLQLKPQAQVMFIKNDKQKRWVNGSLGKITGLEQGRLKVRLDAGGEHYVEPVIWEKVEYKWNKEKEEIEKIVTGTFQQFPIKLAWAVTIHKSQGQTFKNVIVDLGTGAFATGQTYVALSRCETLEGIKLRKKVTLGDIKYDSRVGDYLDSKLNGSMERERYETIIAGLQKQLALLEPENERLKSKVKESEAVAKKAQTEAAATRSELATKNSEVRKLQEEIGGMKAMMAELKKSQTKLQVWVFLLVVALGILGYLLYEAQRF